MALAGHPVCQPFAATYDDCDPAPSPNTCEEPANHPSSSLGDPVDVTTGALEQTATDLDLGQGLAFTRHYASNDATVGSAMGKRWRHSLEWGLEYQIATPALIEVVVVRRPLRTPVSFHRAPDYGSSTWRGSTRGAGGLAGEPGTSFTYTDSDGTRVRFDRDAGIPPLFALAEIRKPGEAPMAVAQTGLTTTYVAAGRCLVVTKDETGYVTSVAGRPAGCESASNEELWTYTHDSAGCLRTARGPNAGAPSGDVEWQYSYPSASGACTSAQLERVERKIGSGAFVEIAAWTSSSGLVLSADEPALDQKLCLGYVGTAAQPTTSVCEATASGACATGASACQQTSADPAPLARFTSERGRIASVDPQSTGGPGVELPFKSVTITAATSTGAPRNLWQTKTDLNGHATRYEGHDARGRPARIVEGWLDAEPSGTPGHGIYSPADAYTRLRELEYHPTLDGPTRITEKSSLTGAFERTTRYLYDDPADPDRLHRIRLEGKTLGPDGQPFAFADETVYGYNASGQLISIAGPRAAQYTEIDYDATTGSRSRIRRFLDGPGSTFLEWSFSDFDARGRPRTVTDPNGRATGFTHDAKGRVLTAKPPCELASCDGANDTTVVFQYDVDGNLTRVTFPNDSAGGPVFLAMGYDPAKPSLLRYLADAQGNAIVFTYEKGRATREERYTGFVSLASPGTRVGDAKFSYNAQGRLLRAFNPLFASDTVFSEFGYDDKGNPTSVRDENGRLDTLGFDALDRLIEIEQVRSATYTTGFAGLATLPRAWQMPLPSGSGRWLALISRSSTGGVVTSIRVRLRIVQVDGRAWRLALAVLATRQRRTPSRRLRARDSPHRRRAMRSRHDSGLGPSRTSVDTTPPHFSESTGLIRRSAKPRAGLTRSGMRLAPTSRSGAPRISTAAVTRLPPHQLPPAPSMNSPGSSSVAMGH